MERIKVCISGVTGWVGKALVPAVLESADLALTGAVARSGAGKTVRDALGVNGTSVVISGSVKEALKEKADVLIDYTSPEAARENLMSAIDGGVNCVVGSSGLSDEDYEEIDRESGKKGVGVIAAGNFAISAALLLHFSTLAARYMPSWEIIDYASGDKVDSPSGTARELAYRLSRVATPQFNVPVEKTQGLKETRGATINGNQVHSVRLPGHIIGSDVLFGRPDERLILKYDGGSGAGPYVEGTLLAVRKVMGMKGLTRGLDNLLDLR